ncbi:MAG TPA: acyltransferase [Dehalococcoidia bacterium]
MSDSEREQFVPADGRIATIDVLRGIAILGVIIIHLWQATTLELLRRGVYLERARDAIGAGDATRAWGASWEAVFALGDYGVTAFMVLSGVSLTIAALRRRESANIITHYRARLPKLLIPYWVGWSLYILTIAVVAWYSTHADGGTFHDRFELIGRANWVTRTRAITGFLLVPRGMRLEWAVAPMPSLWFVLPMVQYYLMFPPLFIVLKRIGPVAFFIASAAISIGSTLWLVAYAGDSNSFHGYVWSNWAPFRIIEFAAGMSIGYVAYEWQHVMLRLRSVAGVPLLIAVGTAAVIISALLDGRHEQWDTLAHPFAATGIAFLVLSAIVWQPRRIVSFAPIRLVAFVGVMSYAVLIVNDCMRIVNHYSLGQGWRYTDGWWFFIVVIYVPVGVALAYPLASMLGLLPKPARPAPALPATTTATASPSESAVGG